MRIGSGEIKAWINEMSTESSKTLEPSGINHNYFERFTVDGN